MRSLTFIAPVALLLCAGASPSALASGDGISSQVVGGLCIPDSATVREGIYETAGFGVRFIRGRVGTVRLFCPFHNADGYMKEIAAINMTFIDSDGMGIGARVRANLRRAREGTNIAETIGTCDSNTSNKTGPQLLTCDFRDTSTAGHYAYWTEVIIERFDPRVEVEFLGTGVLRVL